ncbi:hypothetical protein LMG28138_01717 [Pararobbsia alpina]|uniref:Uncharacterized protein n=1 Tax=Pararobbsia alpina TaxID=621374 RepID=A0A6S7B0I8_9BURK|nr:hypothetical protein LMG28138_01717 [Pararobbsia alpina]
MVVFRQVKKTGPANWRSPCAIKMKTTGLVQLMR